MAYVLEIAGLSKKYGSVSALSELSLQVEAGQVYGLLGPNGSGKTTTLGIILDVLRPTAGEFRWFSGLPLAQAKKSIGALLETPNFYPYLSGEQNLHLVAKIKGLAQADVAASLAQVGLAARGKHKFATYSLGMKQRLALAAALVSQPEVLVLDEPTNGLDPSGIAEVRALIERIAQNGTTVIMASHMLSEVEKLCDQVAVLQAGQLKYQGPAAALAQGRGLIWLQAPSQEALRQALAKYPPLREILPTSGAEDPLQILLEPGSSPAELNRYLAGEGVYLSRLQEEQRNFESGFLELLKPKE